MTTSSAGSAESLTTRLKRWLVWDSVAHERAAADSAAANDGLPQAAAKVLHPGTVESLQEPVQCGRRDRVNEVVRFYRSDAPARVDAMKRAVETADADALYQAARTLKWTSTNIGATELIESCMQLEQVAQERALDPLTDRWLVVRVESLLNRVLAALDTELMDKAA